MSSLKRNYLGLAASIIFSAFFLQGCSGGGGSNKSDSPQSSPQDSPQSSPQDSVSDGGQDNDTEVSSDVDPVVGVFVGVADGLHYSTKSGSGLTNDKGEFKYKLGEIVTFSIGSLELGSTEGSARVTLFDLLSMEPPATEESFRSELENEEVTDFDRVANMAYLLVALDADRNPYTGVSLSGWGDRLPNLSFSLDKDLFKFPSADGVNSLFEVGYVNGIGFRSVDIIEPLTYYYNAMGIVFPVMVKVKEEYSDDDLSKDLREYTYDDLGRLLKLNSTSVDEGDTTDTYVVNYSYNANGWLLSAETEGRKEAYDSSITPYFKSLNYDYDIQGNITQNLYEVGPDRESPPNYVLRKNFNYGSSGEMLSFTVKRKMGDDENLFMYKEGLYNYGSKGHIEELERKSFSNGVVSRVHHTTSSYYEDGLLKSKKYENFRVNFDGDNPDNKSYTLALYRSVINDYDREGRYLFEGEFEHAEDGGFYSYYVTKNQYDEIGGVTTVAEGYASGVSGPEASCWTHRSVVCWKYTSNRSYNNAGDLLSSYSESFEDEGGDGSWDESYSTSENNTINDIDQIIYSQTSKDQDIDGSPDKIYYHEYTYHANGKRSKLILKTDLGADGDFERIQTYHYNDMGKVLSNTLVSYNPDGAIRSISKKTNKYDNFGNGIEYITEEAEEDGVLQVVSKHVVSYSPSNGAGVHYLMNLNQSRVEREPVENPLTTY